MKRTRIILEAGLMPATTGNMRGMDMSMKILTGQRKAVAKVSFSFILFVIKLECRPTLLWSLIFLGFCRLIMICLCCLEKEWLLDNS